jgi:multidrug efflux pump subunit AcrB
MVRDLVRFSVRKPMTVLVAVVLVIILGVVAFSGMTTDLLPNINLPYVIVLTTYPGASPETVEEQITRPLEQSMATLEGISSVSSTSAENYSLLMLEFAQSTNMDTVTGDIREKINLIDSTWDDMVGTPTILKINPDMLPVAVVAVDREGQDVTQLSTFVEDQLLPQLEGIEGVASVSAGGLVTQQIQIQLDQEKIDACNQRIRDAIDAQFAEGEQELSDGISKVQQGIDQANAAGAFLPQAQAQLEQAHAQLSAAMTQAQAQLDEKQAALVQAQLELNEGMQALLSQRAQIEAALDPLAALLQTRQQLEQTRSQAQQYIDLYESYTALCASYETLIAQTLAAHPELTTQQQAEEFLEAAGDAQYLQLKAQMAACKTQLDALGGYEAGLYDAAQTAKQQADAGLAQVDAQIAALDMTPEQLEARVQQLQEGLAQLDVQLAELEKTQQELAAGQLSLEEAYAKLESTRSSQTLQLTVALAQTVSAQGDMTQMLMQLESTRTQLEQAQTQLQDAKKAAYEKADLTQILSRENLAMILAAQNFSMPAGYVTDEEGTDYLLRIGDELDQEQLSQMVLVDMGMQDVEPIRLCDVAQVRTVDNAEEVYAKINGNDGIMLTFSKQSNYATTTSANHIRRQLAQLENDYEGLHFTTLMNQGDYIDIVVDSVLDNLWMGAVLAVLILLLFLRDLRPTVVTAFSIPISLTFAVTLMYFSGVTLNIISLAGLAVAVGMLVDNSIVIIENIYRMRALGMSAKDAAIKGAVQVAAAVTSSTLTTVCVFAPIVFVKGLTRQIFSDMALTIAYSLGASLLVSLTLVPTLSAWLLRKPIRQKRLRKQRRNGYVVVLERMLHAKGAVLLIALALLVCSVFAGFAKGFTYMPQMASTQIMVSVQMEDENALLQDTAQTCDTLSERIRALDGVETVGATLSAGVASVIGLSAQADPSKATLYVLTDPNAGVYGLEDSIEALAQDLPCEVEASGSSTMTNYTSAMGASGVVIDVYANDLDQLQQTAQDLAQILRGVEGIDEVSDGIAATTPELRISVDKDAAMAYGLTVAQVYQQIASAVKSEAVATSIEGTDAQLDVVVYAADEQTLHVEDVRDYTFTVTGLDGEEKQVALDEIAEITQTQSLDAISHSQQRRYLSVSATLADGYNITHVTNAARQAVQQMSLPSGVSIVFAGENETIMESMVELVKMLGLGIVIIYLIMVAQFQSLLSPFIVMFTIPLAFTGGLFALALCGMEMSIVAMIGFIMLVGIIVNNGIVLVDYANQLCLEGKSVHDAIVEAGATRLRPVLMTVLTTVLGLLPLALGIGYGADLMQPVAVVCIGGLLYATLMTLFVVPVLYELFLKRRRVPEE